MQVIYPRAPLLFPAFLSHDDPAPTPNRYSLVGPYQQTHTTDQTRDRHTDILNEGVLGGNLCSYPSPCAMSLIESSIRGDERLHHAPKGDPARVTVVISNGGGSQQLASAAELASIESEKTRQKLKTKAYHVRYM